MWRVFEYGDGTCACLDKEQGTRKHWYPDDITIDLDFAACQLICDVLNGRDYPDVGDVHDERQLDIL